MRRAKAHQGKRLEAKWDPAYLTQRQDQEPRAANLNRKGRKRAMDPEVRSRVGVTRGHQCWASQGPFTAPGRRHEVQKHRNQPENHRGEQALTRSCPSGAPVECLPAQGLKWKLAERSVLQERAPEECWGAIKVLCQKIERWAGYHDWVKRSGCPH